MKNTKRYLMVMLGAVVMSMLWSCSSTMYSATGARFTDDLYTTHDKQAIAKQVAVEREQARIEAQAAREAEERYLQEQSGNPYDDILADDYESAYKRRLKGFESPSYKMPSSYYNFRYGDQASYASAYDPSFYNVMVMGDEVWVEPKYVTSMFGTWGRPVNVNFNMGFGWDSWGWGGYPYSGWGNYWNSPYYGWNSPYSGWGYPHYGWGGHYPGWGYPSWGYPHWGGHYPMAGVPYYNKNVTYRPSYSNYSGNGSSQGYRTPSKYSSGGTSTSNGTRRPTTTTPAYRNRYDKNDSGSTSNRYEQSTSRPTYTPPASTPSYPSGGGSSSGGSYGGSSGRSGGLGGR